MVDAKIINGDLATDTLGEVVELRGADAVFQSALMRIAAKKGSFRYDRELGSELYKVDFGGEVNLQRVETLVNESIAELEGAYAAVKRIESNKLFISLTINGETRDEEVLLNG